MTRPIEDLVRREQTFDRELDLYTERIVDPDSGKLIEDFEEPLSEHHGRDRKPR